MTLETLPAIHHTVPMVGIVITIFVAVLGFFAIGGIIPNLDDNRTIRPAYQEIELSTPDKARDSLQLYSFRLKPSPTSPITCTKDTALDLLVDNSGSMRYGTKMDDLKHALTILADRFPPSGALALQTYSTNQYDLIPFDIFSKIKSQYLQAVNSMRPISGTYSRDGFVFAKNKIDAGRQKFPQYKPVMVFISDGVPETAQYNNSCPGGINGPICGQRPNSSKGTCRCFAENQDPRDIAAQLKQSGVRIFTIAYTDDKDQKFNLLLTTMMTQVASSPSDAYTAPTSDRIIDILKQITAKICQQP